jgi:hypothetical protein
MEPGPPRGVGSEEEPMQLFILLVVILVGFNALIFLALLLRRPRPELRARLFKWVLHGSVDHARPNRHPTEGCGRYLPIAAGQIGPDEKWGSGPPHF